MATTKTICMILDVETDRPIGVVDGKPTNLAGTTFAIGPDRFVNRWERKLAFASLRNFINGARVVRCHRYFLTV